MSTPKEDSGKVLPDTHKEPGPFSFRNMEPITVILELHDAASMRFSLHRDLLCHYSPYFRNALTGNFKEATSGVIAVNNTSEETMRNFTSWIYTQKLGGDGGGLKTSDLIDLYVFADFHDISQLMTAIVERCKKVLSSAKTLHVATIKTLYENLPPNNPMVKLVIAAYLKTSVDSKGKGIVGDLNELPREFFRDSTETAVRLLQKAMSGEELLEFYLEFST